MFASQTVLPFFPSFVWVHDLALADYQPLNKKLEAFLTPMRPKSDAYAGARTWQTDTDLQTRPEFSDLAKIMLFAADGVIDFLGLEKGPLFLSGAWANFGPPGTTHHEHSHPNNFLSGVYYLKAPRGGNIINFLDPRPQAHVIAPRVKKPSTNTASLVTLEIAAGRVVLFPAWLRHSVPVNASQEERVSIAVNIMFEDYGANMSRPRFKATTGDNRRSGAR